MHRHCNQFFMSLQIARTSIRRIRSEKKRRKKLFELQSLFGANAIILITCKISIYRRTLSGAALQFRPDIIKLIQAPPRRGD